MDIKTFNRAKKIEETIETLRRLSNSSSMGCVPLSITYGSFTACINNLDSETERQVISALNEVFQKKIEELTKEFESL